VIAGVPGLVSLVTYAILISLSLSGNGDWRGMASSCHRRYGWLEAYSTENSIYSFVRAAKFTSRVDCSMVRVDSVGRFASSNSLERLSMISRTSSLNRFVPSASASESDRKFARVRGSRSRSSFVLSIGFRSRTHLLCFHAVSTGLQQGSSRPWS